MTTTQGQSFTLDQHVLTGVIFVICALPFMLGDQQLSLVSVHEIGITSTEGDIVKQLVLACLYAASAMLLVKRTAVWQGVRALGIPLLMLLLLCFLSALWAELPAVVTRRSVALAGTIAVGLYAGMRLDERELVQVLIRSVALVLLASFLVAIAMPSSGLDPEGRLRGVTAHKNGLGALAALGLLAIAVRRYKGTSAASRGFHLALAALCVLALVLSDSATPLPVLGIAIGVLLLTRGARPRSWLPPALLMATFIVGILVPLLARDLAATAALLGRDPELSGRTRVWMFSIELLQKELPLGWGYGAVWNGDAALAFLRWAKYPVAHAHNGFLQLGLDLGLIGLMLFAAVLLVFTIRARRLTKTDPGYGYDFAFAYAAFFLAGNITETRLLVGNEPMTMLFIFTIVRVNVKCRELAATTRTSVYIQTPLRAR